ncbi:MAG: hypothetical protein ACI9MR_004007 [Myxococcota bacterium]|jgi:hypothetical protein
MQDVWDSWLKQVLALLAALVFGLCWYFGWLSDAALSLIVAPVLALGIGGLVASRAAQFNDGPARVASWTVAAIAIAMAGWVPWSLVGPGSVRVEATLETLPAPLTLDSAGVPGSTHRLYVNGQARKADKPTSLHLEIWSDGQASTPDQLANLVLSAPDALRHVSATWRFSAVLGPGARIMVSEWSQSTLTGPVTLSLRRGMPPLLWRLLAGGVLLLVALRLEGAARRRQRTGLATLVAGSVAFGVLFGLWYAPGHLTGVVTGGVLVAALLGAAVAYPLQPLFRPRSTPREDR